MHDAESAAVPDRLEDVAATVLEACRVPSGKALDGRSLLGPIGDRIGAKRKRAARLLRRPFKIYAVMA